MGKWVLINEDAYQSTNVVFAVIWANQHSHSWDRS
jgi:hypothetical protein